MSATLISLLLGSLSLQPVECEGTYRHHLQGICIDDEGSIYWSFTTRLVKTDSDGKVLRQIDVGNHHGDLCHHDGRIYVAVNFGRFNDAAGHADSWVYVYSTNDLSLAAKYEVQQVFHGAGGIGYRDGHFFVVGGLPDGVQENYVYEYDAAFNFIGKHVIKSGHTLLGIQTATFAHDRWWFGCYGNPKTLLVTDAEFRLKGRYEFDCSLGIAGLEDGQLLGATGRCEKGTGCTGSARVLVPDDQSGLRLQKEVQTNKTSDKRGNVFLLPYFLGNGETGVYFAWSRDGLNFERLNEGQAAMAAPSWGDESLTRDPSIVYHNNRFHMVWTTSWNSRTIGYAYSKDLMDWSAPRRINIWGEFQDVRNTWAPELHRDPETNEFLILWSSTTLAELSDGDGSEDPHGYDHRSYSSRTKDFRTFTPPELFFSPEPEVSVIDPYIAFDNRGTKDSGDDRWVMVVKHELAESMGGKNLRLTFSSRMQGPFDQRLSDPIVGAGTDIVNRMAEGPSLFRNNDEWFLYWDAPGSDYSYCLATSPDLKSWKNRSAELSLPAEQMRHGTVLAVPAEAVTLPRSLGNPVSRQGR